MNEDHKVRIVELLDRIVTDDDLRSAELELAGILRLVAPRWTEERCRRVARIALDAMIAARDPEIKGNQRRRMRLAVFRAILAELVT